MWNGLRTNQQDGANLPIPSDRNQGGTLEVYQCQHQLNGPHPWRYRMSDDNDPEKPEYFQHPPPPPERKIFNISLPIFILSCALLVVTSALIISAGLLANKITNVEKTIPSPSSNPGAITETNSTSTTSSTNPLPTTTTIALPVSVAGWTYVGCVYDNQAPNRLLTALVPNANTGNMSNAYCAEICTARTPQARHFGTQIGSECFCGTVASPIDDNLRRAPEYMCNRQCTGQKDGHEDCGGNWVLSLWERDGEEEG